MCAGLFSSQSYSWQVVVVSQATQRIRNDICLSWVIVNFQLIVLDQLEPLSYLVVMPKPSTHRMHDPGSIVPHIRPKVLTDN
jgi:hypothetical protein